MCTVLSDLSTVRTCLWISNILFHPYICSCSLGRRLVGRRGCLSTFTQQKKVHTKRRKSVGLYTAFCEPNKWDCRTSSVSMLPFGIPYRRICPKKYRSRRHHRIRSYFSLDPSALLPLSIGNKLCVLKSQTLPLSCW